MILLRSPDLELLAPAFLTAAFVRGVEVHPIDEDAVTSGLFPGALLLSWTDPLFDGLRHPGHLRERRARLLRLLSAQRGPERRRQVRWRCPEGSRAMVPEVGPCRLVDLSAGKATVEAPGDPGWKAGDAVPRLRLFLAGHHVTLDAEVEARQGEFWRLRFPPVSAPDDGASTVRVSRLIYRARQDWVRSTIAEARGRRLFFRA